MSFISYIFPLTLGVFHSKINGRIKVKEFFGKRQIYVDDFLQSGQVLERMWEEVLSVVISQLSAVRSCLVLGVGGGTVIKIIKKYYPEVKIIGIEVDKVMIEIGKKYLDLSNDKDLELIIADAFDWVKKREKKKYFDLIIVDMFIGRKNVAFLQGRNFLADLKKIISSDGLIIVNTDFSKGKAGDVEKFVAEYKPIFDNITVPFKFTKNSILFLKET